MYMIPNGIIGLEKVKIGILSDNINRYISRNRERKGKRETRVRS